LRSSRASSSIIEQHVPTRAVRRDLQPQAAILRSSARLVVACERVDLDYELTETFVPDRHDSGAQAQHALDRYAVGCLVWKIRHRHVDAGP